MQFELLPREPRPIGAALAPRETPTALTLPLAPVEELASEAMHYAERSRAPNTARAYAADWRDFEVWCRLRGVPPLPAEPAALIAYVTERARRLKVASLSRRLAAISVAHKEAAVANPLEDQRFRKVWKGLRREKGIAATRKTPVLTADMRRMVKRLPAHRIDGVRDRALLLLGFAGALRRSELVDIDIADLEFTREGLALTLRHSKTDQEGHGEIVPISPGDDPATCPVRALQSWLAVAKIADGPAFRPIDRWGNVSAERLTAFSVAVTVKRAAARAGLDPARFSGHSLRAGFATQAAQGGVAEADAMRHMRQKSVAVHRGYVRRATLFERNPAARLGL